MVKNKFLSFATVQFVCVLYLVVWTISPMLSIDLIWRLIAVAAAGLWLLVAFVREIEFTREQIIAFVFLVLVVTCAYFEYDDLTDILKPISMYMLCLFFIMSVFYRDKWDELKLLIPVVFILLIIYDIRTAQVVIADPKIARLIVRNDEAIYQYLRQGVGGYGLIYSQVIVFPAMLMFVIKSFRNNLVYFGLGVVWLVSYIVLILNAGYSIAMFASGIGALIMFFYNGKRIVPAFILTLLAFFGILALILYVEPLRNWLLQFFDGTAVARKIIDLVASADSAESEGSIAARIIAYQGSLRALLDFPVIGYLWHQGGGGGHSAIIDAFAKYGWFGGIVYFRILTFSHFKYKKIFTHGFINRTINGSLVSVMFVAFLDSLPYDVIGMQLIFFPAILSNMLFDNEITNQPKFYVNSKY